MTRLIRTRQRMVAGTIVIVALMLHLPALHASSAPYAGVAATIPGQINGENFDNGGEGIAYYDTTSGNSGGQYRSTDVDIESSSEGGYDIGWIAAGEWLNYSVSVSVAGSYIVQLRVSSPNGASMHVGFNGPSAGTWKSVTVPSTGGWQNWTTVSIPVTLGAGTQQMTLLFDTGGMNYRYASVTAANGAASGGAAGPYGGVAVALPGRVEAENFDNGGDGLAYHDATPGNAGGQYRNTDVDIEASSEGGYDVGWIATGEWLNYTVNVTTAGAYVVQLRAASPNGGRLHVGFNTASNVWASVTVPATGGWQTWTTVSIPVTLGAGLQQLTLLADTSGFNLDYVTVAASTSGTGSSTGTQPPTVTLTSPANGTTYLAPITITLAATASTSSGSISKVEFLNGATLIGTATTAPYSSTWSSVGTGTYTVSAKVTTSTGATATSSSATITVNASTPSLPSGSLLHQSNLVPIGTFRLPPTTLGSTWGFGSDAGCCGLGTYGVTFNPNRNSIYVGGHPYEQRLAEIAIPASFSGSPIATALSNLLDPLEGKIGSINPGDANSKIVGGTLVYNGQLIVSAYSYYDGAGTQNVSTFSRPMDLSTTGQVVGPVEIGSLYPGWVDKLASLIPMDWQAAFGGPALAGGAGGAINSLQSWGPSVSIFDPAKIATMSAVPATLVLGYPQAHPLGGPTAANSLWSQSDVVTSVIFVPGTRSVLFFGMHGQGAYCYGPGTSTLSQAGQPADGGVDTYCYDPQNGSKGVHNYPYVSYVWAYDANDLAAVKAGTKNSYDVKPYATWNLDASFVEIQGAAFDSATNHLFVSQVGGDPANNGQPLIRVYSIQ